MEAVVVLTLIILKQRALYRGSSLGPFWPIKGATRERGLLGALQIHLDALGRRMLGGLSKMPNSLERAFKGLI